MSALGPSLNSCYSFFMLFIHSDFLVGSYFTPKLFDFLFTRLLVFPRAFSTNLLVDFSLFIFESPVLSALLHPVSVSFKSHFFRQYLLVYLFKLYCQTCSLFCFSLFIPTYPGIFFPLALSLAVEISLFVLVSFYPGFVILFGFFRGTAT